MIDMPEYEYPSKTFKINFEKNIVEGYTDDTDATKQSVLLMLRTERYAYVIMPRWYGAELERFIGEDFDYLKAAVEGEIRDTLSMDDRILKVSDFSVRKTGLDSCLVSFVVDTVSGRVSVDSEVQI
jgi:hypothetical protein